MSMQLRTSQRISELQDELKQLDEEGFASQITLLEEQCSELDLDIDEAKQLLQESNQKVSQQQDEVNAIEAKRHGAQGQLQTALSTKAALEALQQDASNTEDVLLDGIEKLWQQFSSNQTLAPCVEHAKDPVVAKSHDIQALLQNHAYLPSGIKVFTDKAFVSTARSGSLAHALLIEPSTNESSTQRVPAFFNDIYLCSNDDALAETIESAFVSVLDKEDEPEGIAKGFTSAISPSGLWASSQWVVKPGEASDGALQRANKIKGLVDSIEETESLIDEIEHSLERAKQALEQSVAQKQAIQSALGEKENQRAQIKNKLSLLEMQQEQQSTRTAKLNDELAKQELMLAKEEEQLAQLSEKLELQEAQILEHEVHIDDVNAKRDANERTTSELRALVDTLTSQNHELALKKQQLENHQNLYSQQVTRNLQQREEYIKNKERLQKELTQLTSPEEIQEAELQSQSGIRTAEKC